MYFKTYKISYRFLLFFTFFFFSFFLSKSQIFYTQNGTNLPNPKPDTIYAKKGIYKGYDAIFGVLLVKENRSQNDSRLINIPVIRIPALNKNANPPVFLLNGGPGISNIWEENFPDFLLDSFDIVMVGYRGVDGNVNLDSKNFKKFLYKSEDPLNEENFQEIEEIWQQEFLELSKKHELSCYTIAQVCHDIKTVCKILNYTEINFYAFSYGTMVAQHYIELFPESVNKNVFICARSINENNFDYNDTLVVQQTFDSLLIHHFGYNTLEIKSFYRFINEEMLQIEAIDESKFFIAVLHNIYSIKSTQKLIETIIEAQNGNTKNLLLYQNELHKYFDKLSCFDCITKRYSISKRIETPLQTNSFFSKTISYGNKFWNSAPFETTTIKNQKNIIRQPTLLIYGENDFVSSADLMEKTLLPQLHNAQIISIPNAAHEDALNRSKNKKKEIIEFLED